MKPPSFEETLVWRFVAFTGTLGFIEGLVPRTRLAARALTGLPVEDVVHRAGRGGRHVADTLAGVAVEVSVWAAVVGQISVLTNTLTGFQVQFFIRATHI